MLNFVRQIIEKMSTRIVLEFQHPLEAKDLAQLVALAEKLNASVVEVPNEPTAEELCEMLTP